MTNNTSATISRERKRCVTFVAPQQQTGTHSPFAWPPWPAYRPVALSPCPAVLPPCCPAAISLHFLSTFRLHHILSLSPPPLLFTLTSAPPHPLSQHTFFQSWLASRARVFISPKKKTSLFVSYAICAKHAPLFSPHHKSHSHQQLLPHYSYISLPVRLSVLVRNRSNVPMPGSPRYRHSPSSEYHNRTPLPSSSPPSKLAWQPRQSLPFHILRASPRSLTTLSP